MKYSQSFTLMLILLTPLLNTPALTAVPPLSSPDALSLEGKTFVGSIRAKGIFGLFSRKGSIEFSAGKLTWTVGKDTREYMPAPYQAKVVGNKVTFTSRMSGQPGEYIDWSGIYNGHKLSNVKAVWTRIEGDKVHDTLLPTKLTMLFKQK